MLAPLIKGFVLGLLLSVSVGPVIFAIIKQSLKKGHKAGYIFVAGISASDITMVVICNSFASLFATLLKHEKIIAICGSVFLIILGIYSLFFKKPDTESHEPHLKEKTFKNHELAGIFFSGYLMNILNPGALLFWFTWSALILADAANAINPLQYRFIVFTTCLAVVLSTDILKVLLAGKLRSKLTPKVMHRIDQVLGLVLIGFGVVLILSVIGLAKNIH